MCDPWPIAPIASTGSTPAIKGDRRDSLFLTLPGDNLGRPYWDLAIFSEVRRFFCARVLLPRLKLCLQHTQPSDLR